MDPYIWAHRLKSSQAARLNRKSVQSFGPTTVFYRRVENAFQAFSFVRRFAGRMRRQKFSQPPPAVRGPFVRARVRTTQTWCAYNPTRNRVQECTRTRRRRNSNELRYFSNNWIGVERSGVRPDNAHTAVPIIVDEERRKKRPGSYGSGSAKIKIPSSKKRAEPVRVVVISRRCGAVLLGCGPLNVPRACCCGRVARAVLLCVVARLPTRRSANCVYRFHTRAPCAHTYGITRFERVNNVHSTNEITVKYRVCFCVCIRWLFTTAGSEMET